MKVFIRYSLVLIILISCGPANQNSFPGTSSFEVINPLAQSRKDVAVFIPMDPVPASFVVRSNEAQLAAQNYGEGIVVVFDSLKANEKRTFTIYSSSNEPATDVRFRKRTQAELSNKQIAGLESEKVGYQLSSGIDVFGKRTSDMVLMGIDTEDSESWGMIIMRSATAILTDTDSLSTEIQQNGDLMSSIQTALVGDSSSVASNVSIHAGSRLTKHKVRAQSASVTLAKNRSVKTFKSNGSKDSWGYIATYGKQSLNNDNLGLVILFSPSDFVSFGENDDNHIITLRTRNRRLEYYFGAAWELEPKGISDEKDFVKWVERSARELANPVVLNVK